MILKGMNSGLVYTGQIVREDVTIPRGGGQNS